jgi:hypothetical protein
MAVPQTLDEALAVFQANPPSLVKDKKGQVGNQKTKYADLVQVNAVVLSELNKLGVIYKTKPTLRAEEPRFVLAYELRHVASGTAETGEYPLKLSENPMQMGSAITYARRYILLALTGVAAEDEDDDGQAAAGRYAQRAAQPRQRGEQPTAQRRARSGPAGGPPLPGEDPAKQQRDRMFALLREADLSDREAALRYISEALGKAVETTKDLTADEVAAVVGRLETFIAQSEPETVTPGGEAR